MELLEIFVLALASMIWPALIAVVVVSLASSQPVRLLSWFLAGALLTTVAIGSVIVFLLEESGLVTHSRASFGAAVNLLASAAALLAAYILWRRGRVRGWSMAEKKDGGSWSERALSRGRLLAFVAGIVLNVIPGVFPFVAMKNIAQLDYASGVGFALVIGFYLIMFLPAEIPLASYLFAPERTTREVDRFNAWLRRNAHLLAVYVLAAVGIYLGVRGLIAL